MGFLDKVLKDRRAKTNDQFDWEDNTSGYRTVIEKPTDDSKEIQRRRKGYEAAGYDYHIGGTEINRYGKPVQYSLIRKRKPGEKPLGPSGN